MAFSILLDGKIALVTGGSQGIGEAISKRLGAAGAHVAVAARTEEKARAVAGAISAAGGSAEALRMDVAEPASVTAGVKGLVERHGKLDILVNNAGVTDDGLILRMGKDAWDRVLATDLTGVFLASQEAAKVMVRKKVAGRIVNITSVVGLMGNAGQCNYAASKAGLIGFTKALARELGGRGVTVNAVAPGFIQTAMTDSLNEAQRQTLLDRLAIPRLGQPEDVAEAVAFLAGPRASYLTGIVLNVSGGLHM